MILRGLKYQRLERISEMAIVLLPSTAIWNEAGKYSKIIDSFRDRYRPRPKRTCVLNGRRLKLSEYKKLLRSRNSLRPDRPASCSASRNSDGSAASATLSVPLDLYSRAGRPLLDGLDGLDRPLQMDSPSAFQDHLGLPSGAPVLNLQDLQDRDMDLQPEGEHSTSRMGIGLSHQTDRLAGRSQKWVDPSADGNSHSQAAAELSADFTGEEIDGLEGIEESPAACQ